MFPDGCIYNSKHHFIEVSRIGRHILDIFYRAIPAVADWGAKLDRPPLHAKWMEGGTFALPPSAQNAKEITALANVSNARAAEIILATRPQRN